MGHGLILSPEILAAVGYGLAATVLVLAAISALIAVSWVAPGAWTVIGRCAASINCLPTFYVVTYSMAEQHPGPRDFSETAVAVVDFIVEKYDEEAEAAPESPQSAAGRKGGEARAAALTAEERSASVRRAALARWQRAKQPAIG